MKHERRTSEHTVEGSRADSGSMDGDGTRVDHAILDAGYVAGNTAHGYATTTHAAQGRTVDHAHVVPDGRTRTRSSCKPPDTAAG